MKTVLLVPNAFKGAASAHEAAAAMASGFEQSRLDCKCIKLPIADGGDGSLPIIAAYLNAEIRSESVLGPSGSELKASWGWAAESGTAIIELAEASGIRHQSAEDLNPWINTTFGTGQLIDIALRHGAKKIVLAVGGSATVDGGVGILEALGVHFYHEEDKLSKINAQQLEKITRIDVPKSLRSIDFEILCDVENPLLGTQGAAHVFGPQKGASSEDVHLLEEGLHHLAKVIEEQTGVSVGGMKYAGASGGVSGSLHALLGAKLVSGAEKILQWSGFKNHLVDADYVVTGEGRIDEQTTYGKAPGLIASHAHTQGKYVIGLAGSIADEVLSLPNFDILLSINQGTTDLQEAISNTRQNLEKTCMQVGNLIHLGMTPNP